VKKKQKITADLPVKINFYFLVQMLLATKIGMSGKNRSISPQIQTGFLHCGACVEPSKHIWIAGFSLG